MTATSRARAAERRARRSDVLAWAVRAGLVGYGLLHLLVAWVALRLTFSSYGGQVTGRGALAQLAVNTSGLLALGALSVGFGALVLWQLIAAAVGYRRHHTWLRAGERLAALGRAVVYGYLCFAAARLALDSDAGSSSPGHTTATVMAWPAGTWLVALVGVVTAAIGVGLAVFGWRAGFVEQLDERARRLGRRGMTIVTLGRVGYVAKGLALVVIGVLLVWAGWTGDPHRSGGLDSSLRQVVGGPAGVVAIVVVALGLASFGLFLIGRARHLNQEMITS